MTRLLYACLGVSLLCAGQVAAAENASCKKVRFSDPGDWLKKHPDTITPWLAGVTTFDGSDASAAVKAQLGL